MRQIKDLSRTEEMVREDPESVLDPILTERDSGLESAGLESGPDEVLDRAEREAMDQLVEAGANALRKVRHDGENARLTRAEEFGLEAIILVTGRPALFIQEGTFAKPPEDWLILESQRAGIERAVRSVGRVEVDGHPVLDWIGTGFLVSACVLMTNRHVAKEFCTTADGRTWTFELGVTPRVDFNEELGAIDPLEFAITEVIGVHSQFDMALFRVEQTGGAGAALPPCLPVDAAPPLRTGDQVYVVGYPASDSRRNDPDVMRRIFRSIYNVKRLQPGELTRVERDQAILEHDCSTLGGNSGSCVIDLQTHKVLGLHFGGRYGVANKAVMLSGLPGDPLLHTAGIEFV
jgi:hypothetical protein